MTSEVDSLVQRIARLERQNRQLKLVGLGIALGMAFLLTAAAKTPRTVEAEKIVLRDSHGRARITIGTPTSAGAVIGEANPDGPIIWLTDEKGSDRAMLTTGGLFFANGKARPTVSLSSDPKGVAGLKLYGTDGKVSWSAP